MVPGAFYGGGEGGALSSIKREGEESKTSFCRRSCVFIEKLYKHGTAEMPTVEMLSPVSGSK